MVVAEPSKAFQMMTMCAEFWGPLQ
jgi:hypothetical protein